MKSNQERKKYLVVGANSFLAREIILRLKTNHEVTGIYNNRMENLPEGLNVVPISEIEKLPDQYQVVFIISALVPDKTKPVDPGLLMEVNATLPEKICNQFMAAKIVYASSVSVYGESKGVINENSECINPSPYGLSKLKGEQAVSSRGSHSILRISSMYGIGMNQNTFIPQIIDSALKEKRIKLYGNGSRMQNYIHVSDVAEFFIRSAEQNLNGVFLATSRQSNSNKEIADEVKTILKDTEIIFEGEDNSDSFNYDAEETYKLLNYRPKKSVHKGISELIQWQQKMF